MRRSLIAPSDSPPARRPVAQGSGSQAAVCACCCAGRRHGIVASFFIDWCDRLAIREPAGKRVRLFAAPCWMPRAVIAAGACTQAQAHHEESSGHDNDATSHKATGFTKWNRKAADQPLLDVFLIELIAGCGPVAVAHAGRSRSAPFAMRFKASEPSSPAGDARSRHGPE